jgi:hypothetical protein
MSKELTPVDDPIIINVRTSATVEEALGISDARFQQLGWIIDDIWSKKPTKAEAILALANAPGLTDTEKVYMGWKTHERLANLQAANIPLFGGIIRKRLK